MLPLDLEAWEVRPSSLGINTLLILVYASRTSFVAAWPGWGRGRASMTLRSARAGTELSTEFWSRRVVSFSIKGAMRLEGVFATRGPRLFERMSAWRRRGR